MIKVVYSIIESSFRYYINNQINHLVNKLKLDKSSGSQMNIVQFKFKYVRKNNV